MKRIRFATGPGTKDLAAPAAAKAFVPEWYRQGELKTDTGTAGMKACVPFLDAMLTGYMLTTWEDIKIRHEGEEVWITYPDSYKGPRIINERRGSNLGHTLPTPSGHASNHLVWSGQWGWQVPRGHSVLVTHPLNRADLPFFTLSGIIDSDGWVPSGNLPFYIRKGFDDVIPKGTPIAQIIPFKRANWEMEVTEDLGRRFVVDGRGARHGGRVGYYKDRYWNKKSYT